MRKTVACFPCGVTLITTLALASAFSVANAQVLNADNGCQLVALLPFSDERDGPPEGVKNEGEMYYGYGLWPNKESLEKASFSLMVAAEIAVKHFNSRDTSIVPELAALDGTCGIMFPPILYRDSGYSRPKSVGALLDITTAAAGNGGDPSQFICAVIGPTHPRANEGVSAITENWWIPQLAYSTIDRRLSRRDDFPTLARTITSSQDYGFAIANFVQRDVLKRDFLAVIYDVTDYGEQYEDPLEDAEDYLDGYSTITEHIIEGNRASIEDSLRTTVEDGFHSILLATDRLAFLDNVAEVAEEMELVGNEYVWLLSGDMLTPAAMPYVKYPVGSPTDKLLRGAAVFTNYDPFVYYGENDPFLQSWRQQNDSMAAKLNDASPLNKPIFDTTEAYFQEQTPTEYASFLYDSVILTGISACKAYSESQRGENASHVGEVFETQFQGASGFVQFSDSESSSELTKGKLNGRDISGVIYGMYNVRGLEPDAHGMGGYELVLTHLYTNDTQVSDSGMPVTGSWVPVEGAEFIFFDGTTVEPMPLKTTVEFNYLSQSIHILGLFLVSLALFIAIGSGIWVYVKRNDRIVKASQPEFLYLLCIGAAMVALSLFFISWDEEKGTSTDQLSAFCAVFPWLFVLGYQMMYLALFFKLWRLSKLLSMKRQAVQVNQALIPFAGVIACSMIVLVIWQATSPLTWNREVTNPDDEAAWVSYGECGSKESKDALPFVISLGFIVALSIFVTGGIAWKLKDVQAELAETKWIFFGIFSHIQVWAIGIPVFVILDGVSRDASYLISAALTFIFSTSLVVLVIWPKMYFTHFGGPPKPKISISVAKRNTVVSGLDTGASLLNSHTSMEGNVEQPQAEVNAGRVLALEAEIQEMILKHNQEKSELTSLVDGLRDQAEPVMEAEVWVQGVPALELAPEELQEQSSDEEIGLSADA